MTNLIKTLIYKATEIFSKSKSDFTNSEDYWQQRYKKNGNSGAGSYNKLAEFKADILNQFVADKNIKSVIEYGSGDGNQLKLAQYQSYIGFDVSPIAVEKCRTIFSNDSSKKFKLVDEFLNESAELTLSLDVIYHLVEDDTFSRYMDRLFSSSTKFVIVYASNTDEQRAVQSPHVRHRHFTNWVTAKKPTWKLIQHIPNKYPYNGDDNAGSFADFYIFEN